MNNRFTPFLLSLFFLLPSAPVFSQNIDFFTVIDMKDNTNLCPGKMFADSASDGNPKGIWSVGTNGPATVFENANVWYVSSMSRFLTQDERDSLSAGPNTFWVEKFLVQENIEAPDWVIQHTDRPINDIGMLLDWDDWENGTITYVAPPYEHEKAYGFFVHVIGMGDNPQDIENTDNNPDNDWAVEKVFWGCTPVSVADLLKGKPAEKLTVYPNPASGLAYFDIISDGRSKVAFTIRDITGRTVMQKAETAVSGKHTFQIGTEGLNEGVYFVEVNTGAERYTGKFIIKR
jgi:hypothetical protein